MRNRTIPTALLLCLLFAGLPRTAAAQASYKTPELFTYQELVQLYEQKDSPEPLQSKLNLLLTTPFVSNAAAATQILAKHLNSATNSGRTFVCNDAPL